MTTPFAFVILFALFFSCQVHTTQTPAFYHWKTELALTDFEKEQCRQLGVKKLYVKFFDVDWNFQNRQPVSIAPLQVADIPNTNLTIIPTIFITNRTLQNIQKLSEIDDLAHRISRKITALSQPFSNHIIEEIQIDCDWTQSTQEKYFHLLKKMTDFWENKDIVLSATIRLHQVKFREQTGIPPVNRGMLMYYNMGSIKEWETENSILDNQIGVSYLKSANTYPLPLDIALPVFHWGVLFRDGKLIKIINQLEEQHLSDDLRFIKKEPNRWEVLKNTYLDGYYLYKGDQIRQEQTTPENLHKAIKLLNNHLRKENRTIAFYHLDSINMVRFPAVILQSVIEN